MIETEETKAAITAAQEALEREGFSWIRKSALTERAYYLGLYSGLEAIASEKHLKQLLIMAVFDTLFVRDGDDSFAGTRIGQALAVLKRKAGEGTKTSDQLFRHCVLSLRELVKEHEQLLQHHLKTIDEILSEFASQIEQDPLRERELQHDLLEMLERNLRVVTPLEIDHIWSNNLGIE